MSPVLAELGIPLVAHSPVNHGDPALADNDVLKAAAAEYDLTPHQLALAWVHNLGRRAGHRVIPLPGTARLSRLPEIIAAASMELDDRTMDDLARIAV